MKSRHQRKTTYHHSRKDSSNPSITAGRHQKDDSQLNSSVRHGGHLVSSTDNQRSIRKTTFDKSNTVSSGNTGRSYPMSMNNRTRNQGGSYYANSNTAFFQKFQENYKKQISGERGNQLYQSAFPLKHIPEKLNFSYRLLGRNIFNKSASSAAAGNVSDGSLNGRNERSGAMRHNRRIEKRFKNYMRFQAQQGAIADVVPNNSNSNKSPSRYKDESVSPSGAKSVRSTTYKRKKRSSVTSPLALKTKQSTNSYTSTGARFDKRRRLYDSSGALASSPPNRRSKCTSFSHSSNDNTSANLCGSKMAATSSRKNRGSKLNTGKHRSLSIGSAKRSSKEYKLSHKIRRSNCNDVSCSGTKRSDRLHGHRRHHHHHHRRLGNESDQSCSVSSYSSSEISYSRSMSRSNSSYGSSSSVYHSSINSDSMSHSYMSSESCTLSSDVSMDNSERESVVLNAGRNNEGSSAIRGNSVSNSCGAGYHSVNKVRNYHNSKNNMENDTENLSTELRSSNSDMSVEDSHDSLSLRHQKKSYTCKDGAKKADNLKENKFSGKPHKSDNNKYYKHDDDTKKSKYRNTKTDKHRTTCVYREDEAMQSNSSSPMGVPSEGTTISDKKQKHKLKSGLSRRKKLSRRMISINSNKAVTPDQSSAIRSGTHGKHRRKSIGIADRRCRHYGINSSEKSSRRRQKRRHDDSSLDSDSSHMDVSKPLYSISHYINNREEMLAQMFGSIHGRKLRTMLPDILKGRDFEEVKARCLDQLECMSKKRILYTLLGKEMTSSSGTEDSQEDDAAIKEDSLNQQNYTAAQIKSPGINSKVTMLNNFKPNTMRPLNALPDQSMEDFTERIASANSFKQKLTIETSTIRSMRMAEDANVRAAASAALLQRKMNQQHHESTGSSAYVTSTTAAAASRSARCVHAGDDFDDYYEAFKKIKRAPNIVSSQDRATLLNSYRSGQTPLSPDPVDSSLTTLKYENKYNMYNRSDSSSATIVEDHSRIICSECEQSYSSSDPPSPSSFDSECSACDNRRHSKRLHHIDYNLSDKSVSERKRSRRKASRSSLASDTDHQSIESTSHIRRWVDTLIMTDAEDECILVQSELDFLTDQLRNRSSSPVGDLLEEDDQCSQKDAQMEDDSTAFEDADDHDRSASMSIESSADDEQSDADTVSLARYATSELWNDFEQLNIAPVTSPDSAIASDHSYAGAATISNLSEPSYEEKKNSCNLQNVKNRRKLKKFQRKHPGTLIHSKRLIYCDDAKSSLRISSIPKSSKRIRESIELWLLERQAKVLKAALQRDKTLPIDEYYRMTQVSLTEEECAKGEKQTLPMDEYRKIVNVSSNGERGLCEENHEKTLLMEEYCKMENQMPTMIDKSIDAGEQ